MASPTGAPQIYNINSLQCPTSHNRPKVFRHFPMGIVPLSHPYPRPLGSLRPRRVMPGKPLSFSATRSVTAMASITKS